MKVMPTSTTGTKATRRKMYQPIDYSPLSTGH